MLKDRPDIEKKISKAVEKYKLNSATYTEGIVIAVIDNLLSKIVKITKKVESEMKLITYCPKNLECNLLDRENRK